MIQTLQHAIEQHVIAVAALIEAGSTMGEDVVDLSDGDDGAMLCRGDIQNGRFRGRHGKVASVGGSLEITPGCTDERPRDHAADIEGIDQPARNRTNFIKPLQPEALLMRGNLKYAVRRRVTDRLPGLHVLVAELFDDLGSGGVPVAKDAREGSLLQEFPDQFLRKAGLRLREVSPVEPNGYAGNLPVTRRCILSAGLLARASVLQVGIPTIF